MAEDGADKAKQEKSKYNMWQNSGYMIALAWREHKATLWLCLALAALAVAGSLIELFVAPTVLGAIERHVPLGELLLIIAAFSLALMARGALNSYVSSVTLPGRVHIRIQLVVALHEKFARTSYPNTEDTEVQKKLESGQQSVSSNSAAGEAIWNTLTEIVQNMVGFVIYLALLSALEPWVALVSLVTTVAGFFINRRINSWGFQHRKEEAEYTKKLYYIHNKARDAVLAKDIRIFGMRTWLGDVFERTMRLHRAFIVRGEKVYIWANIVDLLLAFLRNGAAYAYLINLTIDGGLSVSQFLLYFAAVGGFTAWINGIFGGLAQLHRQGLDLSHVREFLEIPEPFRFEDGEPLEPVMHRPYGIELRNVSYRYPGADEDTLTGLSLTIRPGEKLAIVGLNGAGKTTLIKLVCGFYDPTEGEVLLNGRNIKEYNRRDYYRHFSAVFQQHSLLAMSIANNVGVTDDRIDKDRLRHAIEMADLTSKIDQLPAGSDTQLGKEIYENGIHLSGGETQRLLLARALYKDAPIVVLDEPTAALDPIAESDIYSRYSELTGGRTSIYISHRLASTRICDRIILLSNGTIAEEGTHDSLLKLAGQYARLFEIQGRYYREGGGSDDETGQAHLR